MVIHEETWQIRLPEQRVLTLRDEGTLVDEGLVDGTSSQVGAAVLREDLLGRLSSGLGSLARMLVKIRQDVSLGHVSFERWDSS